MDRCGHKTTLTGDAKPFMGGVAERSEDMNEAAHGGIELLETCQLCGKQRRVLFNGHHLEHSLWHRPEDLA